MSKIKISREIVNSIANQKNEKYEKSVDNFVSRLFSSALKDLSKKVSYITNKNVTLQPVNELMNGTMIDNSFFVYFLGVNSPQIEINTTEKSSFWNNFKKKFIYAWRNRKYSLNINKKKSKRRLKKEEKLQKRDEEKLQNVSIDKYTIYNLTQDIQNEILKYLSETSLVYCNDNVLELIGKDDFGSNTRIIVYVVGFDGEVFKYFTENNKIIPVNIGRRYLELTDKIKIAGENVLKIIKIFNYLYYNTNGKMPNQVFIESIVCACPNDLFDSSDIYSIFVKIVNFLSPSILKTVKSLNDMSKTIFEDDVCGQTSYIGFNKMLNSIISD